MKLSALAFLVIAGCAVCALAAPASAVLMETTYKGTVTSLDQSSGSVTVLADSTYGCTFAAGGATCGWDPMDPEELSGTVPDNAAFSVIEVGDPVEATSIGGAGGTWIGIGRLVSTGEDTWVATDFVGDPGTLVTPLVGDYQFAYNTTPDCTQCTGAVCPATAANVVLFSENMTVLERTLAPGESFIYNGRNDASFVNMTFVSGEAPASLCTDTPIVGPQAISTFILNVNPPIGFEFGPGPVIPGTGTETPTPAPTPAGGLPLAAAGALAILGYGWLRRGP